MFAQIVTLFCGVTILSTFVLQHVEIPVHVVAASSHLIFVRKVWLQNINLPGNHKLINDYQVQVFNGHFWNDHTSTNTGTPKPLRTDSERWDSRRLSYGLLKLEFPLDAIMSITQQKIRM